MSDRPPDSHPDEISRKLDWLWKEFERLRVRLNELEQHARVIQRELAQARTPAPPPVIHRPAPTGERPAAQAPGIASVPTAAKRPAQETAKASDMFAAAAKGIPHAALFGEDPKSMRGTVAPATDPKRVTGAMEVAIGKTWLNRIGALILLLGVGFFVKYSFDQGWISPTLRIIIGFGCGFALVVAGEYFLYREMNNFAVGLLGAGTAVLYFASFAGHYFYHLYSTNAAFGALSGVTMLSTVLAVQGNMQAIAILSLIGGFWTPYALSTGQNQQLALSVYLLRSEER